MWLHNSFRPLIDLNPQGELPVLVDGDVVLRDS